MNGNMRRRHICNHHRNCKRINLVWSALFNSFYSSFRGDNSADPCTNECTDTAGILFGDIQSGVFCCHNGCSQSKLGISVHMTDSLSVCNEIRSVKILYFPGNLNREISGIKTCNVSNSGFSGNKVAPECLQTNTHWRNHTKSSYRYSSFHQKHLSV